MFNKLATIAVSLIAGPALAQGTSMVPASISKPAAKADTAKSTTTASVKHAGKTTKHMAKMLKHRKHFAHLKRQAFEARQTDDASGQGQDRRLNRRFDRASAAGGGA